MKKSQIVILFFLLISLLLITSSFTSAVIEATTPEGAVQQTTGIDITKVPKSTEDVQNISNSYLNQEWEKILGNSTIYGPIHRFFIANPLPFRFLFGMPYELSLLFLGILLLWIFTAFPIADVFRSLAGLKGLNNWLLSFALGAIISVLLAQIGFYKLIVSGVLDLIYNRQNFWVQIILWIAVIILLFLWIRFISPLVLSVVHAIRKKKEENELEHSKEVLNTTAKGIIKGTKEID